MSQNKRPLIAMSGMTKTYGDFRLGPVDLNLYGGYIYGVVGQNGAGKTTLLKSLMNLIKVEGSLEILGMEYPKDDGEIKKQIGYVPEEPFLYKEATAEWLGKFVSAHYINWDWSYYWHLLKTLGVDKTRKVRSLSRGTKVKLEMALALAHRPRLLVLDEPTSGLDPIVRNEILSLLAASVEDDGMSVLFSTHITEDVDRIADYIVFIVKGQVAMVSEREPLRELWQEMLVDVDDAKDLPRAIKVDASYGNTAKVVTSDAPSCLAVLASRNRAPIAQRSLGLDEILGVLDGKGVKVG